MKMNYESPILMVIELERKDVIRTSITIGDEGGGGQTQW